MVPQQFGRRFATAPAFADIAARPGVTRTALGAFLATPHPVMPNLILEPGGADDVIAYILGLAPKPRKLSRRSPSSFDKLRMRPRRQFRATAPHRSAFPAGPHAELVEA